MKSLVIVLLRAATATAQEPTESDLLARVRDIAALSVKNADSIESLRDRVSQLENRVFAVDTVEVPVATVVESITPPILYTPVIQAPVVTYTPVVTRKVNPPPAICPILSVWC